MSSYAVITGDLVRSRTIVDRAHAQRQLLATIDNINNKYEAQILSRFSLTAGDEFQGVLTMADCSLEVVLDFVTELFPLNVRFGIGLGPVSTDISDHSQDMDGPCFHRSRAAINYSRSHKRLVTCRTGVAVLDSIIEALLLCLQRIMEELTPRQRELIAAAEKYKTQVAVAAELKINKATVSRTLSRAGYQELSTIRHALRSSIAVTVALQSTPTALLHEKLQQHGGSEHD